MPVESGLGLLTADHPAALRRRHRQERPDPALRLAARRHGGPHARVSALIHAATMVTAGVYMVARSNPLFGRAPGPWSGWAVIGVGHRASSPPPSAWSRTTSSGCWPTPRSASSATCSSPCGVAAFAAGIFHLMTHAFFKALPLPRLGQRDPWPAPRAGHAQHGRPAQVHPGHLLDHVRSAPWPSPAFPFFGLLLQGRDPLEGVLLPGRGHLLFYGLATAGGRHHRLLHVPADVPDLPRGEPDGPGASGITSTSPPGP